MVLKSAAVLSCLLPARLGFGPSHRPDSPSHGRDQEKLAKDGFVAHGPEFDPFRGDPLQMHKATDPRHRPDLLRARANTAPPSPPNGFVSEAPRPVHRSLAPPVRQKRSSFTTFFAFSSKRRSSHGALQQDLLSPPQSVHGRWVSDAGRSHVHVISPTAIPSPLRGDEDEYYYSYYASNSVSPNPSAMIPSPSKSQRQDPTAYPDPDSRPASPGDSHLSHTPMQHPYAYSTPLRLKPYPKPIDTGPCLRHSSSQPLQQHIQGPRTGLDPSQHQLEASKSQPHLHPELKTSMSTPNLGAAAVRPRSLLRKRPSTKPKGQERWLSAETWWDALFSPSPRFKVKRAPRPSPTDMNAPISEPARAEPNRNLGVTFPSIPAARPRAVSVASSTSHTKHTVPLLARSRSAAELSERPATSGTGRTGFEPALETLVDQPTPPPEQPSTSELGLPEPPLSLEEVLSEGEALEQQRARWKHQASKSIGNKHTRSFSRARSKSLGEKQARLGRQVAENNKSQLNFEFLAARTLLGSQSTMPVVHVTKPSSSSSHPKASSHSHSQSAYSYTHSSHSRAYSHSHSHSHSLTTSNSSKSSRQFSPRAHSRNGSWSKSALLKAGALCGIAPDDSGTADGKVPSSSRVDVQGTIVIGPSNAEQISADADKASPAQGDPCGEVGIAISSSPAFDSSFGCGSPDQSDRESRWSSKHTHKSSEYAGPHPSAVNCDIPQLSGVSLRHRLPPRPGIHPPIAPMAHPYRSVTAQTGQPSGKRSQGTVPKVPEGQEATEPGAPRNHYLSLNNVDFEQYGVGEALVYASSPRPHDLPRTKQAETQHESSPSSPIEEPSPIETTALQCDGRDSSSGAMNSIPSLTNSTIQMVMSAFDDPDDLDEFQDLFYKPHTAHEGRRRQPSVTTSQVPTDVRSSPSNSPLTHLVRKLSEEVNSLRDPTTPSDLVSIQRSESQDQVSNKTGAKFVFMDVARSSSPPPMESCSQLQLPIQEGDESALQPVAVIPEDVHSFYTSSVLDSPLEDRENDTFGYPIKHGRFEASLAPAPVQSPMRASMHLSIQDDETEENETAYLSPVTKRSGLVSIDAVRASYVTTSDLSRMSGLSDFPLPPGARPVSVLHAYDEAMPSSSSSHDPSTDGTETGDRDRHMDSDEDGEPSGDVKETLRALRTPRVASYQSHRSTFGGSDDMDFIAQVHQGGP